MRPLDSWQPVSCCVADSMLAGFSMARFGCRHGFLASNNSILLLKLELQCKPWIFPWQCVRRRLKEIRFCSMMCRHLLSQKRQPHPPIFQTLGKTRSLLQRKMYENGWAGKAQQSVEQGRQFFNFSLAWLTCNQIRAHSRRTGLGVNWRGYCWPSVGRCSVLNCDETGSISRIINSAWVLV